MTYCNTKLTHFSPCKGRKIEINFNGGTISSDGGVLLLREIDKKLDLTKKLVKAIPDTRHQSYCDHDLMTLLRQRIFALALGYEDVNDHQTLRHDIALQTAVDSEKSLGSPSTLSRFENSIDRKTIVDMHKVLIENFVQSFKKPPQELILDFDATDAPIHGNQAFKFYHGYYREYCFLPLYVFCGEHLLVSYLRPSFVSPTQHTWAILALLAKRFRQVWPNVKIIFRGDSAFCKHRMFDWCEKHEINYITGIGRNNRLLRLTENVREKAEKLLNETEEKQRLFETFTYAADTWSKKRRIIIKAEQTDRGANPRFIVTNLTGDSQQLYDEIYCARGEMENHIKAQQLDLFADRTSCHEFLPNQFRLMLSSCAYTLLIALKNLTLKATSLAKAQCGTMRLKLFKVGAVIIRNTRKVKFLLSSAYPEQDLFIKIGRKLCPE